MNSGRIHVGTSGWSYKTWADSFYPAGVQAKQQLAYYVRRFPSVEINASFYRLPTERALTSWRDAASPGFVFAVKGSRSVTHYKPLNAEAKSFPLLLKRIAVLRPHLGPVLWQLPPHARLDLERLDRFLEELPKEFRHALEFRHRSWFVDSVFERLSRHRVALVAVSSQRYPECRECTTDFVYVRFHGLAGGAAHDYTRQELQPWADDLREHAAAGRDCYVYFNNDMNTRAPLNASLMMSLLEPFAVQAQL